MVLQSAVQPLKVMENYILNAIYNKDRLFTTNQLYTKTVLEIRLLYVLNIFIYVHKYGININSLSHTITTPDTIKIPAPSFNAALFKEL